VGGKEEGVERERTGEERRGGGRGGHEAHRVKEVGVSHDQNTIECELLMNVFNNVFIYVFMYSLIIESAAEATWRVPELRASVHQVEDLRRVQQLLELAEELHPLVVSTFRVDQDQQGAGARGRGGLPEA